MPLVTDGWRRVVIGMLLALPFGLAPTPVPSAAPVAAQEAAEEGGADPLDSSSLTVNVELVLDASGSMAEAIQGTENQSRMEAAKAAMRDVIAQIPEREGLNVGFRLYGHEGSNRAEDKAESCRSTELLVPMAGVDREALLAQVEAAEPTGWTPLARALTGAATDFESGGESVTNAVIMVTDGEETCGGDPCAVAAELNAAEIALTTHVVGFALTPEQRNAVRCIAEEGGGQLFAAEDAESLGDAVFSAFEQVETAAASVETAIEVGGYVGGNAFGVLGEGQAGALSVVAVGPFLDGELPIVLRNDTGADVERVAVSAVARADGALVASGAAQGIQPFLVEDGGLALAYVYFNGAEIPAGAEFEFSLEADPVGTDEVTSHRDLIVEEVNGVNDGVVGIVSNPHDETVVGFIILALICFDESGQALGYAQATASNDGLAPGDTISFDVSTTLDLDACPLYLVAGYGSAE